VLGMALKVLHCLTSVVKSSNNRHDEPISPRHEFETKKQERKMVIKLVVGTCRHPSGSARFSSRLDSSPFVESGKPLDSRPGGVAAKSDLQYCVQTVHHKSEHAPQTCSLGPSLTGKTEEMKGIEWQTSKYHI
jgi:hypothetical protein